MEITKKQWLVAGISLLIVAVVAGALWQGRAPAPVTESPASEFPVFTATTTPAPAKSADVVPSPAVIAKFQLNPADTIVSWSFKGAYTGNDALVAKANADIAHLTGLIGKGQYDDYDLYLGIGNDADLLGDGARAYQNYNRSISIHPKKGLAYDNLGHLMDELGAYHTAADAYAKAVAVEPLVSQYRNAQIDFLTWRFPVEAARLKAKQ